MQITVSIIKCHKMNVIFHLKGQLVRHWFEYIDLCQYLCQMISGNGVKIHVKRS